MATGRDIRAGKAFVEIEGDDNKLVRALKRSSARIRAFGRNVADLGRSMAMVGGAALAAFGAAAKIFSSMGDNVAKMARRTGFSVEALSELSYAAQRSGTDIGSLENSLRRMQRTIYDASRGLSTAVDGLADLGLSLADLQGMKPVEQFKLIAQRLSEVEDATTKAGIAMTLFGRSGTALLPMLEGGAAGIDTLQKAARRLGLTISTEDSVAAEQFTDAMGDLKLVIKHNAFAIGSALAPKLKALAEDITTVMADVRTWISANQDLIITIAKTAAKLTILGVGLLAVGKGCAIAAAAVKGLTIALTLLKAHPIILAFAGIAAAAGGVVYLFHRIADGATDYGDAVNLAADATTKLTKATTQLQSTWKARVYPRLFKPPDVEAIGKFRDKWSNELYRQAMRQMTDDEKRAVAQTKFEYDLKIEAAKKAGFDTGLIEVAQDREIAAVKQRFEKERAEERRRRTKEEWAEARRIIEGLFDARGIESVVKRLTQARGTFYAAALPGLAAAGPINQIAENTKVTAAEVKRMRQQMAALQAVWLP